MRCIRFEHARVRVGAAVQKKGEIEQKLADVGLTPLGLSMLMVRWGGVVAMS